MLAWPSAASRQAPEETLPTTCDDKTMSKGFAADLDDAVQSNGIKALECHKPVPVEVVDGVAGLGLAARVARRPPHPVHQINTSSSLVSPILHTWTRSFIMVERGESFRFHMRLPHAAISYENLKCQDCSATFRRT